MKMTKGDLEVVIVDAKGLKDTDLFGKIDPYVIIQYRNQEQRTKTVRDGGGNPQWNQKLKFTVHSLNPFMQNATQHKLTLRIMDHDTSTADDFIGQATIHVGDVIAMGLEKGMAELPPSKHRVVLEDNRYHGEIQVGVTFRAKMEQE